MTRATPNTLGELLISQRRRLGLSQTQLSEGLTGLDPETACSKSRISEIENGRGLPSIGLARLCDQFFGTGNQFQAMLRMTKNEPYLDKYASTETTEFAVQVELITTTPSQIEQHHEPDPQDGFEHFQPIHLEKSSNRATYIFDFGATVAVETHNNRFRSFQTFAEWLEQHTRQTPRNRSSWPTFFCAFPTKATWSQQKYNRALQLLSAPSELRRSVPAEDTIDLTNPAQSETPETLFLDGDYDVIGGRDLSCPPVAGCYATSEGIAYHASRPTQAPAPATVTALAVQTQALLCAAHAINTNGSEDVGDPADHARHIQRLLLALVTPQPSADRRYQHLVDGLVAVTGIDRIANAAITILNSH